MPAFEYKVVPAPKKGVKNREAKTPEERFAIALQSLMNELGAEGWEYQRTDTLPSEERQGLTGRTTVFQNMLVFRRALGEAREEQAVERAPEALPAPPAAPERRPDLQDPHEIKPDHGRREPDAPAPKTDDKLPGRPVPAPEPHIVQSLARPEPKLSVVPRPGGKDTPRTAE